VHNVAHLHSFRGKRRYQEANERIGWQWPRPISHYTRYNVHMWEAILHALKSKKEKLAQFLVGEEIHFPVSSNCFIVLDLYRPDFCVHTLNVLRRHPYTEETANTPGVAYFRWNTRF
jgi:hypothetical protein